VTAGLEEQFTTKEVMSKFPEKHKTICVGNHYMQTNTNNVNKTTGGKDKMNIVFCGIRNA
jgi:hypothetical protein